jgi:hypothetical protein
MRSFRALLCRSPPNGFRQQWLILLFFPALFFEFHFLLFHSVSLSEISLQFVGFRYPSSVLWSFFLSNEQSDRIPLLHKYIRTATVPPTLIFRYWFVNATLDKANEQLFLFPSEPYRSIVAKQGGGRDIDLAMKFWFCMRFFLEDPHPRWLFRGTDDTVLNFGAIGDFFLELEQRYDPLKDPVFLGDCVRHGNWLYPQGGSGYLLSRAAVELIEPLRDHYVEKWPGPEDMNIGLFLLTLNISMRAVASPAFMGHSFSNEVLKTIRERKWESFPTCPALDLLPPEPCGQFLGRLRDVVFFHQYDGIWPWPIEHARGIFEAPPDLYWYQGPMACRTANCTLLRMYPGWPSGQAFSDGCERR